MWWLNTIRYIVFAFKVRRWLSLTEFSRTSSTQSILCIREISPLLLLHCIEKRIGFLRKFRHFHGGKECIVTNSWQHICIVNPLHWQEVFVLKQVRTFIFYVEQVQILEGHVGLAKDRSPQQTRILVVISCATACRLLVCEGWTFTHYLT